MRLNLFGMLVVDAPYLPWTLLGLSLVMGSPVQTDLLGIAVGHLYYFLADVYPSIAAARAWRVKELVVTPAILYTLTGTPLPRSRAARDEDRAGNAVVANDALLGAIRPEADEGEVARGPVEEEDPIPAAVEGGEEGRAEGDEGNAVDHGHEDANLVVVRQTAPPRRNEWAVLPEDSDDDE
jgi:hypothetical protein